MIHYIGWLHAFGATPNQCNETDKDLSKYECLPFHFSNTSQLIAPPVRLHNKLEEAVDTLSQVIIFGIIITLMSTMASKVPDIFPFIAYPISAILLIFLTHSITEKFTIINVRTLNANFTQGQIDQITKLYSPPVIPHELLIALIFTLMCMAIYVHLNNGEQI